MQIREIISELEKFAPLNFQEDYDNSGLLCGDPDRDARGALLSLDCTEEVIDEAIAAGCNLVIAHHPLIFSGIKRLTGNGYVNRTLIKAIKNDIAIYACHTNIDNVSGGVNKKIADKLGLTSLRILAPKGNLLRKLVTFVPPSHHQQVRQAMFDAGAGHIGNYDQCSYNLEGRGTFRGNTNSDPFLGEPGKLSDEPEMRVETIVEAGRENQVVRALLQAHPYEEVAYDLYDLENQHSLVGSGMIGDLKEPADERLFLERVKSVFKVPFIKHTAFCGKPVKKVAICGGSGRFLLKNAISAGADAFITSDFKYHEYFDATRRLLLADIGHYESEQFTPEIFYEVIRKKFSTFAVRLSKINTNPVNYF